MKITIEPETDDERANNVATTIAGAYNVGLVYTGIVQVGPVEARTPQSSCWWSVRASDLLRVKYHAMELADRLDRQQRTQDAVS